jgi:hypothetical protein
MRRIIVIGLAVAVASLAVPVVPAVAHNAPKKCGAKEGDGAGWWKVRAHSGVRCRKARTLAQAWEDKCVARNNCPGEPDKIFKVSPGWKCWTKQHGYESVRVRCLANEGPGIVHFLWGS